MSSDLVTVRVEQALEPRQQTLSQAIALVRETLRTLPLGRDQLEALGRRFGADAEERIREEIAAKGSFEVCFLPLDTLDGNLRAVEITPAVPGVR
ncbi:hypothetical protein [Streptomyces sp. CB03911]|uniref:hypothetical protein n=1 Tax=Streptomyces sp. CB03911 TaxID=1804758 RepID=UPI00093B8F27|nr:hypothetical protein [Streptomyces sp. CB03911]OKI22185.1 hypothetical protein A6A07_34485 [Streptomyces sp. CB03911]